MGRGRQKAKHTKVARELKYFSPETNYSELERELTGSSGDPILDENLAKWADYAVDNESRASDEDEDDEAKFA
ncbi:MAG: DUF3073 domain-containing protein [Microbacteriaceae bacterium]|nr:DUF3073 domain-containing protein [Microbacteriaceae bacterium]